MALTQADLLLLIRRERRRQDEKWGVQDHGPDGWLAILVEEVGEVAKAMLEGDYERYDHELIQVGAVAVAALECLHRTGNFKASSLVKLQLELKEAREELERMKDDAERRGIERDLAGT